VSPRSVSGSLVVDPVDRLIGRERRRGKKLMKHEDDPDFAVLKCLLELARDGAVSGTLRVVFVTSNAEVEFLPWMHAGHDFRSNRMTDVMSRRQVCEVGDVEDAQAESYLRERGVAEAVARDAVATVTGGNLIKLSGIAASNSFRLRGSMNEDRRQFSDNMTRIGLHDAKVKPDHALFQRLLQDKGKEEEHRMITGKMRYCEVRDFVSAEELDALLRYGLLTVYPDNSYSLRSRQHAQFFQREFAKSGPR
jgi:hypothetical protein